MIKQYTSLVAQMVKESACNAGDLGLIPWLGRSPWRRERLATPVFWPGEFHGLYGPRGRKESDTTERLGGGGGLITEWVDFSRRQGVSSSEGSERAQ